MKDKQFFCKFCDKYFVHEKRYLKHECEQMRRDAQFKSPQGQAAWQYYQKWMRSYRRVVPDPSAFLKSTYYLSFMRFAKFVVDVNMPDTNIFIQMMRDEDIIPTMWTRDEVYVMYTNHLDRVSTPIIQAQITVDTLESISDEYECDISEVFDHLTANEVIQMLRQRRLSPWVLLHSDKFKQFFVNHTSGEERIVMEQVIKPSYWSEKFSSKPEDVQLMKLYVAELSL